MPLRESMDWVKIQKVAAGYYWHIITKRAPVAPLKKSPAMGSTLSQNIYCHVLSRISDAQLTKIGVSLQKNCFWSPLSFFCIYYNAGVLPAELLFASNTLHLGKSNWIVNATCFFLCWLQYQRLWRAGPCCWNWLNILTIFCQYFGLV